MFSIFGKVVPCKEKEKKTNLEKRYFFQTGILFENKIKTMKKKQRSFMWRIGNFF